jgi:4-diphosphocytidyl-2-C-methyl-D-erythritol kinase
MSADNACLKVVAPAKLNLTFEIGQIRADGFHEISSLFHTIDLCDSISFSTRRAKQFSVTLNAEEENREDFLIKDFPLDDSNLICKAAYAFVSQLSEKPEFALTIDVQKNIPIAAGLGGGSSDAAASLFALNEICGKPFSLQELSDIGSTIGADVPFCLIGGTALGEGKGEILTAIPVSAPLHFVIAKPAAISISTAWAYNTYDQLEEKAAFCKRSREAAQLLKENKEWQNVFDLFGNDFEEMIIDHHSLLSEAKDLLLESGAVACHLTGKGPTLYAITHGAQEAEDLSRTFSKYFDSETKFDCWTAKSLKHGVKTVDEDES